MSGPLPMTRFSATAATRMTCLPPGVIARSYGDRRLDARVRVVALDRDVLEVEAVDRADLGVEHQRRQRPRLARELQPRLVEVVGVEVGVAERVHEVADL